MANQMSNLTEANVFCRLQKTPEKEMKSGDKRASSFFSLLLLLLLIRFTFLINQNGSRAIEYVNINDVCCIFKVIFLSSMKTESEPR